MAASTLTVGRATEVAFLPNRRPGATEGGGLAGHGAQPSDAPAALDAGECQSACGASLTELISHIVRVHHRRLRSQLFRMWTLLDQLDESHEGCLTLFPVREVFESVLDKLVDCMLREGGAVFPQIEYLEAATVHAAPNFAAPLLDDAILELERRQFTCLLAARKMNELTGRAEPAIQRCVVHRELAKEMASFSGDLFQYLFEVNCVLLVRAQAMSADHRPMSREVHR